MYVIINPGTGPVDGSSEDEARKNMEVFVEELRNRGNNVVGFERASNVEPDDGRYDYGVHIADGRTVEIEMPGLPLEEVRFTGEDDQNPWHYPRLYVDGSSWLWKFALWNPEDFDEDEE